MATRHRIPYGDSSVVIRTELPSDYDHVTTATLAVRNTGGTELLAAGAATPKDIGTLGAAVVAGKAAITLAATPTTNPVSGDLLRVLASADGNYEDVRVESYDSSTRVVKLVEYLEHDHAAAAVVYGRWLTRTIDCSSATNYPAGVELVFEWGGFDSDDVPFTEDGEILRRTAGTGDLHGEFKAMYSIYYNRIQPEYWDNYERNSWEELRQMFMLRGRDIDNLVASHNIEALHMAQIAYMIAFAGGDDSEAERAAMATRRNDLFDQYANAALWHDDDQDVVEDDDETAPANRPWPRRRL